MKDLSARELQVLIYLTAPCYYSHGEIAEFMGISLNCVRMHISSIHEKLGISSRVEALLWLKSEPGLKDLKLDFIKKKPKIHPL